MDIKGTILRAKDGHPVPGLERDGLKRHLGSMIKAHGNAQNKTGVRC